jgi:cytochrome oxidase Cu insertion factor (SCO1/SenC/PrrC family)
MKDPRGHAVAMLLVFAGIATSSVAQQPERSAAELMDAVMWNREPIGGSFTLIDHNGAKRTDADFRGKLMLVYFGFTSCPDICPTDLQAIGLAVDQLGKGAEQVQPIFVTVDPERDTPQLLADYVPMFHPRLIGLSGELNPGGGARIQGLLRESAQDGRVQLHHRSLGLHLSDGSRWPLRWLLSAWHVS